MCSVFDLSAIWVSVIQIQPVKCLVGEEPFVPAVDWGRAIPLGRQSKPQIVRWVLPMISLYLLIRRFFCLSVCLFSLCPSNGYSRIKLPTYICLFFKPACPFFHIKYKWIRKNIIVYFTISLFLLLCMPVCLPMSF